MRLLTQLVIAAVLVVSEAPRVLAHPPHPIHPDHPDNSSDPTDLPISPVPEPSSIILLGTGMALFVGVGIRRKMTRREGK